MKKKVLKFTALIGLIFFALNTDVLAEQVNVFLGSIGVDFYYPHPDNNYKGELGNA